MGANYGVVQGERFGQGSSHGVRLERKTSDGYSVEMFEQLSCSMQSRCCRRAHACQEPCVQMT